MGRIRLAGFLAVLAIFALLLAACGGDTDPPAGAPDDTAAEEGPDQEDAADVPAGDDAIRIGALLPLTGPTSAFGQEVLDGINYALAQIDYEVDGRPLEVLAVDDKNDPAEALTQARRVVERQGAHIIVGTVNSAVALALHEYAAEAEIPYITSGIVNSITQDDRHDYTFRATVAASQFEGPLGQYLYEDAGYRRAALLGADYAAGHDAVAAVRETFESLGGEVVEEEFPRQGETDYSAYFSRVAGLDADFVFGYFWGGDALRFASQYREFDMEPRLVSTAAAISSAGVWQQMGPGLHEIITPEYYVSTIDTPENEEFVSEYQARFRREPTSLDLTGYIMGRATAEAVSALDGGAAHGPELAAALEGVQFDLPYGEPFVLDDQHNPVLDIFIVEWLYEDGEPGSHVVRVFEDVDQHWEP